jgi:hypothetical protein
MIRIIAICMLLVGGAAAAGASMVATASPAEAEMTTR